MRKHAFAGQNTQYFSEDIEKDDDPDFAMPELEEFYTVVFTHSLIVLACGMSLSLLGCFHCQETGMTWREKLVNT